MTTTLSLMALEITKLVDPLINTDMGLAEAQALFDSQVKRQEPHDGAMLTTWVPFAVGLCEASFSNTDLSVRVLGEFYRKGIDIDSIHDHDFGSYVESKTLLHCALVNGTPEFVSALLKMGSDPLQKQVTSMKTSSISGGVLEPVSIKNAFELVAFRERDSEDARAHKALMKLILQSWSARHVAHDVLNEIEKTQSLK